MRVTSLNQLGNGHWVMEVERDVVVRRGLLGIGSVPGKKVENYASRDGFAWVDSVSGARVPYDTEIQLERLFDREMDLRPAPAM